VDLEETRVAIPAPTTVRTISDIALGAIVPSPSNNAARPVAHARLA
jgi:hypothetical protein